VVGAENFMTRRWWGFCTLLLEGITHTSVSLISVGLFDSLLVVVVVVVVMFLVSRGDTTAHRGRIICG